MVSFLKINIKKNRIYGLDILRCLAILFVVFGHGRFLFPEKTIKQLEYFVFDGVGIFFVLSGYLIGDILIRELELKKVTIEILIDFWKRRWFRTIPNYILVLTIVLILNILYNQDFNLSCSVPYYFFMQNLYFPHPNWFPEAWSLSVEEWFYLIVPILIFIVIKIFNFKTKKSVLVTAVFLILLVTVFRYFKYLEIDVESKLNWDLEFRKQVFTRLDSIMFGVVGAYIAKYYYNFWIKYKLLFFMLGLALLLTNHFLTKENLNLLYKCVFTFTLNSIGTLFVLPYLSEVKTGKGFFYKAITYISIISYSMYLINYTLVKDWIIPMLDIDFNNFYFNLLIKYMLFWVLTIILSVLLYKYFEVPTTKLRDKKII